MSDRPPYYATGEKLFHVWCRFSGARRSARRCPRPRYPSARCGLQRQCQRSPWRVIHCAFVANPQIASIP